MSESSARILVVDDSPFQRDFVAAALRDAGYTTVTAENGVDALNRVHESPPDVIVSDVMMPELSGYQFCRILKNDPRTAGIPVILLTSLSQQQDKFWGRQAGADRYVVKDEAIDKVVDATRELVDKIRATPRPPAPPSPGSGFTEAAAKSRLGHILEQLLFEAVVANRVRDLFRHATDPAGLSSGFFDFLHEVFRFKLGALLVRSPRTVALHLDLAPDVGHSAAREMVWKAMREHAPGIAESAVSWSLRGGAKKSKVFPVFGASVAIPVRVGSETPGVLLLMDADETSFTGEERRTLSVVERELGALLTYLASRDEIEAVKADFMSMIVHDLRSPLAGILAGSDILAGGMAGPLTDEQKQVVEILTSSSKRLMGLVNEVLDMSRIDAGRLTLHKGPAGAEGMIRSATDETRFLAHDKGITVEAKPAPGLPSLVADHDKVEQVLVNLITNAIKFTPSGGKVTVGAEAVKGGVRFSVKDTGPGIPEEERRHLFEKYSALAGKRRAELKGTGLGLFICKSIVEAHGGTVGVDSAAGEGSTFHFTLPLGG